MKLLPGKTEQPSFGFYWTMLCLLVGALSVAVATGSLIWHLVGIDDLVRGILQASEGLWMNLILLPVVMSLLVLAVGATLWWFITLIVRTIQLALSLRPHPEWVRLWESSLEFQEKLHHRAPTLYRVVYWYTKVMSKFGTDTRHPLPEGANWVKAFLTTTFILIGLVGVPWAFEPWHMPVGVKPLFPLLTVIESPILADFVLSIITRRKHSPPANRWRETSPQKLDSNNHRLPPP